MTCEDNEAVAWAADSLMGQRVRLEASADGVSISAAAAGGAAANGNGSSSKNGSSNGSGAAARRPAASAGAVERVRSVTVVPLEEATVATAGAKAASCGELLRLAAACSTAAASAATATNGSSTSTAIMSAPDGVVLPFGCMEAAAAADGKQERLAGLIGQLEGAVAGLAQAGGGGSASGLAALDAVCGDIQGLLAGLTISQQVRPMCLASRWAEAALRVALRAEWLAGMPVG